MIWFGPTNCIIISTIIFTIIIIISLTFSPSPRKAHWKKCMTMALLWCDLALLRCDLALLWCDLAPLWCGWHSFDVIWHPFDVGGILVIWGSFKVYDGGTLRCDVALLSCLVAPLWCEEKYMTMAPLWCEAVSTKNGDNFRELSPRLWRLLHTSKIKIFHTISNRPLIQQKSVLLQSREEVEKLKPSENFWDFLIHHFCFSSVETSWSG